MFLESNITPGDFLSRPVTAAPVGTALLLMVDPATDQLTSAEMQDIPAAAPSGVVLRDGTAALTANWDAGAFEIRAETFQSDVATGTAPLIVASTTAVANLNADLLDGQHGSYYATAADVAALTSGYSRRKSVINRVDNTAAPPTEVSGDRYLLDATGASHANWDGALVNQIVEFNGTTWDATAPAEGWIVYNDNSDTDWLYVDDGSPAWQERTAGGASDHGALSGLTDDDHTQYLLAAGTRSGTGIQEFLGLNLTDSTELTIASGAVTVTQGYHTIDTESDAATDDLDTITVAGGEGDLLILRAESSARTVVIKHGTGNIQCAEGYDLSLDSDYDYATLIRKDGTNWMAFSGARRMPPYVDNGDTLGGALAGDIYYHDGTTVTNLRIGTTGQRLEVVAGAPSWEDSTLGLYQHLQNASVLGTSWITSPCRPSAPNTATAFLSADSLIGVPLVIHRTLDADRIAISVSSTGTASNARIGIYNIATDGFAGSLVLDCGVVDVSATGDKEIIISQELAAGQYYMAIVLDGTCTVLAIDDDDSLFNFGFSSAFSSVRALSHFNSPHTYAALPATFPSAGLSGQSGNVPRITLRVS